MPSENAIKSSKLIKANSVFLASRNENQVNKSVDFLLSEIERLEKLKPALEAFVWHFENSVARNIESIINDAKKALYSR